MNMGTQHSNFHFPTFWYDTYSRICSRTGPYRSLISVSENVLVAHSTWIWYRVDEIADVSLIIVYLHEGADRAKMSKRKSEQCILPFVSEVSSSFPF